MSIIKKLIKALAIFFLMFVFLVIIMILSWTYVTRWRLTEVGEESSPDGKYSLLFQEKGEPDFPFGYSHAKVTLYKGDEKVNSFLEDIADDGGGFRKDNYSVEWLPAGVIVTFHGSEQADKDLEIFYDDGKIFEGYSKDEIKEILKKRYGIMDVERMTSVKDGFIIKAEGVSFYAENDMALHNSFLQESFKKITEDVFLNHTGRGLAWENEEGESRADIRYIPIISVNGTLMQDIDAYCSDICRWLHACLEKYPYDKCRDIYICFIPDIYGYSREKYYFSEISMKQFIEDDSVFYNELYAYLNNLTANKADPLQVTDELYSQTDEPFEVDEGTIRLWASYEAGAVYDFEDGTEYAMIPVDRALGSSYYVLMSFREGDRDKAELVNIDPYNGSGGETLFISFINDSDLGFSCLTYSGGSEGMLFRTSDKGKSFQDIALPSPEIELSDGKYYNPFVMPEEVWEENGMIYLKVGQGPEGDYYNKELDGKTCGIYVSEDEGRTFHFLKEKLCKQM